jgi:pilus assembly protein CpaB
MSNEVRRRKGIGSVSYALMAILCAGFAAFLLVTVLKAQGYKQEKKTDVLVAVHSISAGSPLAKEDVRVVSVNEKIVPADAVTSLAALFPEEEEPPLAASGIIQGEFILKGRLADARKGTAMAGRVREGYRAFAVTVDKAIARSRLVFPGARVDVVGTFRESQISMSRLLVENARVLSLESQIDVETARATDTTDREGQNRVNDTVVTIEVTPPQAEIVALAAREGTIDLVLRNANDVVPAETPGVTTVQVMSRRYDNQVAALDGDASRSATSSPTSSIDSSRSARRNRARSSRASTAPQPVTLQEAKGAAASGIEVISGAAKRR